MGVSGFGSKLRGCAPVMNGTTKLHANSVVVHNTFLAPKRVALGNLDLNHVLAPHVSRTAILPGANEVAARETTTIELSWLMCLLVAVPISCCAKSDPASTAAIGLGVASRMNPRSRETSCVRDIGRSN